MGGELKDGEWVLSPQRQSIITSLLSAGTFFGAILQCKSESVAWLTNSFHK